MLQWNNFYSLSHTSSLSLPPFLSLSLSLSHSHFLSLSFSLYLSHSHSHFLSLSLFLLHPSLCLQNRNMFSKNVCTTLCLLIENVTYCVHLQAYLARQFHSSQMAESLEDDLWTRIWPTPAIPVLPSPWMVCLSMNQPWQDLVTPACECWNRKLPRNAPVSGPSKPRIQ